MKSKIFVLFLFLVFALCGCGNNNSDALKQVKFKNSEKDFALSGDFSGKGYGFGDVTYFKDYFNVDFQFPIGSGGFDTYTITFTDANNKEVFVTKGQCDDWSCKTDVSFSAFSNSGRYTGLIKNKDKSGKNVKFTVDIPKN